MLRFDNQCRMSFGRDRIDPGSVTLGSSRTASPRLVEFIKARAPSPCMKQSALLAAPIQRIRCLNSFAGSGVCAIFRRFVLASARFDARSSRPERPIPGEMAERSKAHAWKACVGQPTVGSNPTLSAIESFLSETLSARGAKLATLGVCAAISRGAVFGSQPETADGPGFPAIGDRKSPRRSLPVGSLGRENRPSGDCCDGGLLQARRGPQRLPSVAKHTFLSLPARGNFDS